MPSKAPPRGGKFTDVLLVTQDVDVRNKFAAILSEKNDVSFRVLSSRALEFEHMLEEIKTPDILILDLQEAKTSDTDALERIKTAKYSDVRTIVVSSFLDQDTVRRLVQIKVDDWLPKDCSPLDAYRSFERALFRPAAETPQGPDATCFTFLPVCGGAGNTTLAIQAAFTIGRKRKNMRSVVLVDLNFPDGMVAEYLDLSPAFKIEEITQSPARLDQQLLDVMLSRHSSGLAVLASPRLPARRLEVGENLVASVLGLLSKSFETIVIDLPKTWYPWTENVVWGSEKVFIVTSFLVPALRQARFVADAVISKAPTTTAVSVLVNRFHEPLFGSGLHRKDAERLLGNRLGGFLPDAAAIVEEAINRGLPISEVSAGSKLEKRLSEIILAQSGQLSRKV